MTLHIPYFAALTTYFSYALLFVLGHAREFFRWILRSNKPAKGYAPLCRDYEDFYTRRIYYRTHDCWNRPIASAPDAWIDVIERRKKRKSKNSSSDSKMLECTSNRIHCLNVGSYNYLGFAAYDEYCTPRVVKSLENFSPSTCSGRMESGTLRVHQELEQFVAKFLNKEDAVVFGMGFATNSLTLPAIVGKGCLVVSDSLNHASIVAGVRGSGAKVRVFRHNSPEHLERVLRESIAEGQPRTHRPWKKVLIIVEGIYSMEGELCRLPEIVQIKKKYKAYLFLDEAHSIGAIGTSGRGVTELTGVNTSDVDIMMGTFTKSFGSCGGYLAGSKEFIAYMRHVCPASLYSVSLSPPAAEQILSAFKVITGEDGSSRGASKLSQLRENSNWFRRSLLSLGFEVLGDEDSPVMPVMLYNPAKISAFSRECLKRKLAVVVVGFPATPLLLSRARICISAAHSKEDLQFALEAIDEVGSLIGIKYMPTLISDVDENAESVSPSTSSLSSSSLSSPTSKQNLLTEGKSFSLEERSGGSSHFPSKLCNGTIVRDPSCENAVNGLSSMPSSSTSGASKRRRKSAKMRKDGKLGSSVLA